MPNQSNPEIKNGFPRGQLIVNGSNLLDRRSFLKLAGFGIGITAAAACLEARRHQVATATELVRILFPGMLKGHSLESRALEIEPTRKFNNFGAFEAFNDQLDQASFPEWVDRKRSGDPLPRLAIAQDRKNRLNPAVHQVQVVFDEESYRQLLGELPRGVTAREWADFHFRLLNDAVNQRRSWLDGLGIPAPPRFALARELIYLTEPAKIPPSWEFFPYSTNWINNQWPHDGITLHPFLDDGRWAVQDPVRRSFAKRDFQIRPELWVPIHLGVIHDLAHFPFTPDLHQNTGPIAPQDPLYENLQYIYFCRKDIMGYLGKVRFGPISLLGMVINAQRSRSLQADGPLSFLDEQRRGLFDYFPSQVKVQFTRDDQVLGRESITGIRLLREFSQPTEALQEVPWDEESKSLVLSQRELEPWHAIVEIKQEGQTLYFPLPRYVLAHLTVLGTFGGRPAPADFRPKLEINIKKIPKGPYSLKIEVIYPDEVEDYLRESTSNGWQEVARTTVELPSQQAVVIWTAPASSLDDSLQVRSAGQKDWQQEIKETQAALDDLKEREGNREIIPSNESLFPGS